MIWEKKKNRRATYPEAGYSGEFLDAVRGQGQSFALNTEHSIVKKLNYVLLDTKRRGPEKMGRRKSKKKISCVIWESNPGLPDVADGNGEFYH